MLIGALDVDDIVSQLDAISDSYGNPDNITLTNAVGEPGVTFGFTLKLKFPDGVTIAPDAKVEAVAPTFGKDAFAIKSSEVNGQEITVRFGLADDSVDTFDRLSEIVHQVGYSDAEHVMKIRFSGLTVTGSGQQTITVETLQGSFFANAKNAEGTVKPFNFTWNGVQSTAGGVLSDLLGEGKDAAQAADDNTTIAFTLNVAEKPAEPTTEPTKPTGPVTPTTKPTGSTTTTTKNTTDQPDKPVSPVNPTKSGETPGTTAATEPAEPTVQPAEPAAGSTAGQPASTATGSGQTLKTSADGKQVPETGDHMNLTLWLVVLIAAAVASVITLTCRKKTED